MSEDIGFSMYERESNRSVTKNPMFRESENQEKRLSTNTNRKSKRFTYEAAIDSKDQIKKEIKYIKDSLEWWKYGIGSFESIESKKKRIHELLVQSQTEEHETPGSLFNLVLLGDLTGIKERLVRERKFRGEGADTLLVCKTDAAGGNIIHAAYLYQMYHIGQWLVENYPLIALEPYSDDCTNLKERYDITIDKEDMPYTGENILHMTIVRKDLQETRWILDFYKEHKDSVPNGLESLLLGNAVGKFFDRGGGFYCGSYPLHFAACSNDTEMFDLILTYASSLGYNIQVGMDRQQNLRYAGGSLVGNEKEKMGSNVIFMRDRYGNNCLHLAVNHLLKEMYAHIKETARNLLQKEIRLAYAQKLWDNEEEDEDDIDQIVTLTPLPNHEGFSYGFSPTETDVITPRERLSAEAFSVWLEAVTDKKIEERMELVLNEDYHSPLTLCASQKCINSEEEVKKAGMISFLLQQLKKHRWSYGPIACSLLNLEGVEYPYYFENYRNERCPLPKESHMNMHGLIEWVCITDSHEVAKIPEIKKIIVAKWRRFGYFHFFLRFTNAVAIAVLITLLVVFEQGVPNSVQTPHLMATKITSVLFPITAFLILLMVLYEVPRVHKLGWSYFSVGASHVRGAAKFEKVSKVGIIVTFVSLWISEYSRSQVKSGHDFTLYSPGVKVSMGMCAIISWIYLYYFFMGFDKTGAFVLTIYRIVSGDIPFFVTFYMVVMVGFACAFSNLTNDGTPNAYYGFQHLGIAIFNLIQVTVQMQQPGNYAPEISILNVPPQLYWLYNTLFTIFFLTVVLMLYNVIIAMINNTYGQLVTYNQELLLIEKYNIMSSIQFSLLDDRKVPQSYSVVVKGKLGSYLKVKPTFLLDENGSVEETQSEIENGSKREELDNYAFEMLDEDMSWWGSNEKESSVGLDHIRAKVTLMLIMPQNDIHEDFGQPGQPGYRPRGSLAVPGSNDDSFRIQRMILKNINKIDEIIVAMDSHYVTHIAHAIFWRRGRYNPDFIHGSIHPDPFTVISYNDIVEEIWAPYMADEFLLDWVKYYTRELEKKGRLQLTIWPEHCIIGSKGHNVVPPINEAIQEWCKRNQKSVKYAMKGQNLYTEMYSVLAAEVEDPTDPTTGMDWDLLEELKIADKVLVCGQALSHCVNFTFRDILKHWHGDASRLHLLKNGCSSVAGFENVGLKFLEDIQKQGVTVLNCEDVHL